MKRILQIIGVLLLIIIVVLVGGIAYVYAQSNSMINEIYDIEVMSFEVPEATDELNEEGRRIFVSRGCVDCHGTDAAGTIMAEDPAFGVIVAPNLTGDYSSETLLLALLHGVREDGTALQIMPSVDYAHWREEELSALLVYLTTLEPVENELPDMSYGPLYRALLVFNQIPLSADVIDHDSAGLVDIEASASVEYGDYLAHSTCIGCHGEDFSGASVPGTSIVAPNLTFHATGLEGWTLEDFQTAIQTGVTPDGEQLDVAMPYAAFASFTDTEVEALYLYLQSVEPLEGD